MDVTDLPSNMVPYGLLLLFLHVEITHSVESDHVILKSNGDVKSLELG